MQILGRTVEAVRYEGAPLVNAYVNQKSGDCRRKSEPDYRCMDNCEGRLVIARFQDNEVYEIAKTVPLREALNDAALKANLNNPHFLQMAAILFGPETAKLVVELRKMQREN